MTPQDLKGERGRGTIFESPKNIFISGLYVYRHRFQGFRKNHVSQTLLGGSSQLDPVVNATMVGKCVGGSKPLPNSHSWLIHAGYYSTYFLIGTQVGSWSPELELHGLHIFWNTWVDFYQ